MQRPWGRGAGHVCEAGGKCFLKQRVKGKRDQGRDQSIGQGSGLGKRESDDKDFGFYIEQDGQQLNSFGHSN